MNLQYISDSNGKTTGVFIPINDWEELKKEVQSLKEKEDSLFEVPEWHKKIIRQRLEACEQHPENIMDWDDVSDNFKFE